MTRAPEARWRGNRTDVALILVLVVVSVLVVYTSILLVGPSWDIMVRYLDGRTLLNFLSGTSTISFNAAFAGEYSNNLLYYFEPYREPLSTPIFAFLSVFFQKPILEYLLLLLICYALAIYKFGKDVGINMLVLFSALLNAYVVTYFISNGGEVLSLIFVLLGLAFLLKKSVWSGLFFGVAGLAKYPSFVLLPLVLLLGERKKVAKALGLEFVAVLPWLAFDYLVYGNPFYSFIASLSYSNVTSAASWISTYAIIFVLSYPAVLLLIFLAYKMLKKSRFKVSFDYTTKVFAGTILLSGIFYAFVLPHNDVFTQIRYGYLFSFALLLPIAVHLGKYADKDLALRYLVGLTGVIMAGALALVGYLYVTSYNTTAVAYYNPDNGNGIYANAGEALGTLGFSSCRIVSNAWVPMLYSGYNAYSPFITHPGGDQQRYPIVAFKYVGVKESLITNLNTSNLVYQDENFSIYLPENFSCYAVQPYSPVIK